MKLRVPDYYYDFKCIGGDCTDSCCIGWELDIDEESYEAYKKVQGEFGKRLRESMVDGSDENDECNTFRLNGERCPFLNDKNLCEIYIKLGEKSLCKVCTEYPRFTVEYENTKEKSMALSCEVVGKLLFERKDRIKFIEKEIPDEEISEECAPLFVREIEYIRDKSIEILQDRTKDIYDRIKMFLSFISQAQEVINEGSEDENLIKILENIPAICPKYSKGEISTFIEEVCYLLGELYVLGSEWTQVFSEFKSELNEEVINKFEKYRKDIEILNIWYENLMIYFVFRYFTKGVYDCDVLSRAKFAFLGFFTINGLAALRYNHLGKFDINDMIMVAKAYSKEVEHSEGNIAYLMEEFLFSEKFNIENLQAIVSSQQSG
nr:flagellin lysine-N-methylase [uncultured Catonella sp.]